MWEYHLWVLRHVPVVVDGRSHLCTGTEIFRHGHVYSTGISYPGIQLMNHDSSTTEGQKKIRTASHPPFLTFGAPTEKTSNAGRRYRTPHVPEKRP